MLTSVVRRGRAASGAIAAPFAQSLSSLVLQVIALRELGADGFGVYALLYSGILLATALSSGLVGDPLTVLDRHQPDLRGGIVRLAVASTVVAGIAGVGFAWATGLLSVALAGAFGLALGAFLVENLFRRLLMAEMVFWRVVVMDLAVLAVIVVGVVGLRAVIDGSLGLGHLLMGLFAAQMVGVLVGLALVPRRERWLGSRVAADVRPALRFGSWRAAQQAVRPASLLSIRVVVAAALGTVAVGELEAARVYAAPTMLVVNGAASFFLASYSSQRNRSVRFLLRRADIGATVLAASMAAFVVVALVALPWAGQLVAGDQFELSAAAVAGWVAYAGACAVAMPYASLASVRGRHALMVGLRVAEALISAAAVGALLLLDIAVFWVPLAISVSPLAMVVLVRQRVLNAGAPTWEITEPDRGSRDPVRDAGVAGPTAVRL